MTERSLKTHRVQCLPTVDPKEPAALSTSQPIRILIADWQPIVLEGLAALIQRQDGMQVVGQAKDVAATVRMCREVMPDVVVFDSGWPVFDSIRTIFAILEAHPSAKVVAFTASESDEHIYQAVQAGARGYLVKTSSAEDIVACIHTVSAGENWIPPSVAEALVRRIAAPQLTRREREVLSAMAEGKSNREIGQALRVSEGTVKVHVTHILEKLQVDGRTAALATAAARGLVSLVARPALSQNDPKAITSVSNAPDEERPNLEDSLGDPLARVS
jgi:two-component system, NarL family, response regulator